MTFRKYKKNQDGVTLLLAILILAAISIVALSFSSIAKDELQSSGDSLRSEPAISGAEAGTEDALFEDIRGFGSSLATNCSSPSQSTLSNGVLIQSCTNYYYPNPYAFTLAPFVPQQFYLYNPASQSSPSGYTSVSLTMNNSDTGGLVLIDLCSWSNNNCSQFPDLVGNYPLSAGQTWTETLDPSQKYILIAKNQNSSVSLVAQSTPFALVSSVTTVLTSGTNGSVTRKIEATIPQ